MVAELWTVGGVFGREGYNLEIPWDLITLSAPWLFGQ